MRYAVLRAALVLTQLYSSGHCIAQAAAPGRTVVINITGSQDQGCNNGRLNIYLGQKNIFFEERLPGCKLGVEYDSPHGEVFPLHGSVETTMNSDPGQADAAISADKYLISRQFVLTSDAGEGRMTLTKEGILRILSPRKFAGAVFNSTLRLVVSISNNQCVLEDYYLSLSGFGQGHSFGKCRILAGRHL